VRLIPLLICLLLVPLALPMNARPAHSAPSAQETPVSPTPTTREIRIPLVRMAGYEPRPGTSIFGAHVETISERHGLAEAQDLGMTWLRRGTPKWREVEQVEGGPYDWTVFVGLEQELIRAAEHGVTPILFTAGAPRWATTAPSDCGPIKPEYRDDYARFLAAMVSRYSKPPYNVKYWEIGNEPDVDPSLAPIDSGFGCWGNLADNTFYGGETYGEMLRVVYPAIKAADPEAQVLFGGLLLNSPNGVTGQGHPERFLRGALEAMKDDPQLSFDILSFHGYRFAFSTSPFDSLGGFILGKVEFLRQELARYGRAAPPMINTETALLCVRVFPEENERACRERQAAFVARIYIETMVAGLLGSLWYVIDSDSFYNSALVNPATREPRASYLTYRATVAQLGAAQYQGRLENQPRAISAYRFGRGAQTLIAAWSDANATASVPIPAGQTARCLDRDGIAFACPVRDGNIVQRLTLSPIYIVFE
jgi:hypothetical protein